MPRIKDIPGPYRVFFTSFDCNEPAHVHVERENSTCKFWLEPIELARNHAECDPPTHQHPPPSDSGGMA
jgi:hypothetical protein